MNLVERVLLDLFFSKKGDEKDKKKVSPKNNTAFKFGTPVTSANDLTKSPERPASAGTPTISHYTTASLMRVEDLLCYLSQ